MRPGVIVLVGLPGAGNSTLAEALARRLPGARVLDKDKVRHVLFDPCDYTSAERDVVFAAMLDAARYHLGRDRIVIFDGLTFSRRSQVAAAETVVSAHGEQAGGRGPTRAGQTARGAGHRSRSRR